jgi:hypothetical protein
VNAYFRDPESPFSVKLAVSDRTNFGTFKFPSAPRRTILQ